MILLVVGLVAVIVVILIAVFLSIRLGRGDEHDDELEMGPSGRNRRAEEDSWREPDIRDTRRVARTAQAAAGRGELQGVMDDRRRASEPAYAGRERDRSSTGPRPAIPRSARPDPTTPRSARPDLATRRSAGSGPTTPRSAGPDPATPPYDAGPRRAARRRPAMPAAAEGRSRRDTGPSRRIAADGMPAADHPSMDFPAADYSSGEMPSVPAKTRPDGGRSDSRRKAAPAAASGKSRSKPHRGRRDDDDDWPSTEWDSLSDEQYWAELSADKPLATMARPASNSKASAANASADEPAARDTRATRKPEKPARAGAAGGRSPGREQAEREYGHEPRSRRERPPQPEPVTERLPVRSRRQPAVPAARLAAEAPAAGRSVPASQHPSLDTGPYTARDLSRHPSLDTSLPLPVAGGRGTQAARDTGPLPRRDGSRHPSLDTGPRPARDADLAMLAGLASTPRPPVPGALHDDPLTSPSFSLKEAPTTDSRSYGRGRRNGQASPGNGSTPLTSDTLARDGSRNTHRRESGSYPVGPDPATARSAGSGLTTPRSAGSGLTTPRSAGSGPTTPRSAGPDPTTPPYAGPYPTAPTHPTSGYSYPAEPAAAGAQWYAAPPAQPAPAPAYENPYSYPSPGTGSSAGYAGDADRGSYLADPLRAYSPPAYESPLSAYPDPGSASYQALPAPDMAAQSMEPPGHALYSGPYPEHPYGPGQGQPEPAQYQDGYSGAGYQPGYDNGYGGDPYAGGGYGSY